MADLRWKWRFLISAIVLWISGFVLGSYGYVLYSFALLGLGAIPLVLFSYTRNVYDRGITFGQWLSMKWASYQAGRRAKADEEARLRAVERGAYRGSYAASLGARRAELQAEREDRDMERRRREADRFRRSDWLWGRSSGPRRKRRKDDELW